LRAKNLCQVLATDFALIHVTILDRPWGNPMAEKTIGSIDLPSLGGGLPSIAANRGTEPRRLNSLLRGERDGIVMMALEKNRNGWVLRVANF
jgi:hypothetical protein